MSSSTTRFGWLMSTFVLLGVPSFALGQGNIFNPYGNSGYSDYREFGSPKYSTDPGLPGQARIAAGASGSRYNTLDEFSSALEGATEAAPLGGRPSTAGLPFYRAYQLESQQARRAIRSTDATKDQDYRTQLAQRNELYFRALQTTDPKERVRLLREVDRLGKTGAVDRLRTNPAPANPAANRTGQPVNRGVAPATITPPAGSGRAAGALPGRTANPITTAPRTPAPAVGAPTATAPATTTPRVTAPTPTPAPATNPASVPVPPPG